MPLRDNRHGKRATVASAGDAPLTPDFRAITPPSPDVPTATASTSAASDEAVPAVEEKAGKPAGRVAHRVAVWLGSFAPRRSALRVAEDFSIPSELETTEENLSFSERLALAMPEAALHPPSEPAPSVDDVVNDEAVANITEPVTANEAPIVVRPQRPAYERAVPITRLPLRSHAIEITWSALADPARLDVTRSDRHALLAALPAAKSGTSTDLLILAYGEEDAAGRLLAMRALLRVDPGRGRQIFIEALRAGTDEERAFAIDALAAAGPREALIPAFSDRVDAIAAKAALAYVGTNVKDDYERALEPFIERARIEALLGLLAGYLV